MILKKAKKVITEYYRIIPKLKLKIIEKLDPHLYSLRVSGELFKNGWFRSMQETQSIDLEGNPIPWLTYPAIKFLTKKVSAEHKVFEYGAGNSTLWLASRASFVVSCEHDKSWHDRVKKRIPRNVLLIYRDLEYGGDYCREIIKYRNEFDIIIIDGRDRVNCAKNSIGALKQDGIIVFDDSERECYKEGIDILLANSFKKIDFYGMSPMVIETGCTTIFFKDDDFIKC